MKITCISASNIERAREHSTSTRTCELIQELLRVEYAPHAQVEIVRLIDYEFRPCQMCGECFRLDRCCRDEAFNEVYDRLIAADGIFIVSPHYAPIPSKLVMLFEKLEEMVFLRTCDDPLYRFTLHKKPVGIIGHGGQTEEALSYYKTALLDPIATALMAVQMHVVGANEKWPYGVAFGIQNIYPENDSIFVQIEHDWPGIRERIAPLVWNVAVQVQARVAARHSEPPAA
jgi:multimeric flavodoxin WrbA